PLAVGVGLADRAGGLRKRMIAELPGGLGVHQRRLGHLHRRRRILVAAWTLEYVAAVDLLAAQIAGPAGDAAQLVEPIVAGLELVIGHRPVLDRHVLGDGLGAVPVDDMAAGEMVARQVAPMLAAPVVGGAADAVARLERAHAPHWQRRLRRSV